MMDEYGTYIGCKIITAIPAPNSEGDAGYKVVYASGYESWSPKDVFEDAYMEIDVCEKITFEIIEAFIISTETIKMGEKTTVVYARLKNGFEMVEADSCIKSAGYNEIVGHEICIHRIHNRIWELLGFMLQQAKTPVKIQSPLDLIATFTSKVARECFEKNGEVCRSLGDHSGSNWQHTAPSHIRSIFAGVQKAFDGATPEELHESWLQQKVTDGWTLGDVKDADAKTHPCMVPYDDLPDEQKEKDVIFLAVVESHRDEWNELHQAKKDPE